MTPKSLFLTVAVFTFGLVLPAGAQGIPPGTQGGQAPAPQQQGMMTAEDAIRMASQHGVASVREVERDRGRWKVEGHDAQGRKIEVKIDMLTGQVVEIER